MPYWLPETIAAIERQPRLRRLITVIENCAIAACDRPGPKRSRLRRDPKRPDRLARGRAGAASRRHVIDGSGCLLTPGLVNAHDHLYQWITRGLAQDATLFGWLTTLYPLWARIDAEAVHAAAAANLGWLALTGTTTSSDHHYVFPAGAGDLLEAEITAAQRIGVRFHPARGR